MRTVKKVAILFIVLAMIFIIGSCEDDGKEYTANTQEITYVSSDYIPKYTDPESPWSVTYNT